MKKELVEHHHKSFALFVEKIKKLINGFSATVGETTVAFSNTRLSDPYVMDHDSSILYHSPEMCRARNCTYSVGVRIDVQVNGKTIEDVFIGKVPILTDDGFFIIHGNEKVVVSQERTLHNYPIITKNTLKITSKGQKRTNMFALSVTSENNIHVHFGSPKTHGVDLFDLLKVYGFYNVEMFGRHGCFLQESFCRHVKTERECMIALEPFINTKKFGDTAKNYFLERTLLPHVKNTNTKIMHVVNYVKMLIDVHTDEIDEDDIDNLKYRRVDTTGVLLYSLFEHIFKTFCNIFCASIKKNKKLFPNTETITNLLPLNTITDGLKYALATGNFNMNNFMRVGISQLLSNNNEHSRISHLRRCTSTLKTDSKSTKPRQLHCSHWGKLCPSETPEGGGCGILKNFAMMAKITVEDEKAYFDVMKVIEPHVEADMTKGEVYIFVDGEIVGALKFDTQNTILYLEEQRRCGKFHIHVSISLYNEKHVNVLTDGGRLVRPVLNLKHNVVEYIDTDEEERLFIALYKKDVEEYHTHVEIDPSQILGYCASMIPYSNHNQSPRNTYQSAMCKQAIAEPIEKFTKRYDTNYSYLCYPQKALTSTGEDCAATGQNCVVAIACYTGFNQEDSIIMNKASIERGLFRNFLFKTYYDEIRSSKETFKSTKWTDGDGMVASNTPLSEESVIVGKEFVRGGDLSRKIYTKRGFVDSTMTGMTQDGRRFVKTRIREMRTPEVGDKFASRHAQKGVIGAILSTEDMPFTPDGITPDIIINPHCIPSRMTIAHLIETIAGKNGSIEGRFYDARPFQNDNVMESVQNDLKKNGFDFNGNERMTNGCTGEQFKASIFIGSTYYQRLRHMVQDKQYARARGPVDAVTKQPVHGRSQLGGLRMGEMERDALIAHGASKVLEERFFHSSDGASVEACTQCKRAGTIKDGFCYVCQNTSIEVHIPTATQVLFHELNAMGIDTRFEFRE